MCKAQAQAKTVPQKQKEQGIDNTTHSWLQMAVYYNFIYGVCFEISKCS